jgi:hypothetical protein
MATTTADIYIKSRPALLDTIRKMWRIWGSISLIVAAILAGLYFVLDVKAVKGVLQFWAVLNVLVATGLILSSRTVRQSRRWHGADWWLAVISALILVMFVIVGIVPEYLAPYTYNDEAGPARLGPGEVPAHYILITRTELPYENFVDIGNNLETGERIERTSDAKEHRGN